jgi:ribosomal protein S18 acetylase RimI-like enzyme
MFSFLSLQWSHYAACRQLFEDTFDISEIPSFVSAWPTRFEERSITAFYKGALVGFALIDTKMTLRYICIHPEFQNCGLGSKLLTKILDLSADARSIWLTTADNERLVTWYGRYGFRVVDSCFVNGEFIGADMVRRSRCRSALI